MSVSTPRQQRLGSEGAAVRLCCRQLILALPVDGFFYNPLKLASSVDSN